MDIEEAVAGRRSIRRFSPRPVPAELVEELVHYACLAPSPHASRPWCFVMISRNDTRRKLADAMGSRWRQDLRADGLDDDSVARLLRRSRRRILEAPVLLLACLLPSRLRSRPDQRRQSMEETMGSQSLGAALQNLMLVAYGRGLATCWFSAPLFCPDAVRLALDIPSNCSPQAFIALGYPHPEASPTSRPPIYLSSFLYEK
jgi:coenzyme F420-0:L-glutamate ligase/coenzyme F420-1:gamma-L-glutamate ligase